MLKIIVADDEELIRGKIVYLLNNSSIGFDAILEAGNGQEAIDIIENGEIPDIIVTDVRMPLMGGLDLIEKIKGLYPEVRFIVVSGYAEFEYAVKAMQFGVTNYVLKPVKANELITIIEKMQDDIMKFRQEKEAIMQTESVMNENRRMVFEKTLYSFLTSQQDDQDLEKSLGNGYLTLKHSYYGISAMNVNSNNEHESIADSRLPGIQNNDVSNIIRSYIGNEHEDIWIIENFARKDAFVLVFGGRNASEIYEKATKVTKQTYRMLNESYRLSVTVGISNVCTDLKTAYKNSVAALKQRFLSGANNIIFYSANVIYKDKASESFVFKVKLLEKSLENACITNAKKILMQFAEEVFIEKITDYLGETSIDYLFNEYINIIIRYGLKNNTAVMEIIDADVISGKVLEYLDDKNDILKVIEKTVENIFSYQIEECGEKQQNNIMNISVMDRILNYINKNINDEITLQTISEKFIINPSYLSRVFKATTGQGFVQYVTSIKIEKAKELLKNNGMDIADIALGLGFSDQQYFNRVFKKTTGHTPNEVRNMSKKSPKNS